MIETHNLTFQYEVEGEPPREVLHGVDLTVEAGSFVAVLGHNGSGKSTLAKHFNAILLPSGGSVTVLGVDTKDQAQLFFIRQHIGMVFQNPDNQIVATVVEEDVAFGLENLGVEPVEIRRRVDIALRTVGMYDERLRAPHQLSGGQKQRVAIAGIIAMRPRCIVLDEPTAMLDPGGREQVMNCIHQLNRQLGLTVVLITHFMEEAVGADRVVVMERGRILLDGTPKQVFSQVEVMKGTGLGLPQATELADLLRRAGVPLPEGILTDRAFIEQFKKALQNRG